MYHLGVGNVDNGGDCACVGAWGIWKNSGPYVQYLYKPKTTLKNSLLKEEIKKQKTMSG